MPPTDVSNFGPLPPNAPFQAFEDRVRHLPPELLGEFMNRQTTRANGFRGTPFARYVARAASPKPWALKLTLDLSKIIPNRVRAFLVGFLGVTILALAIISGDAVAAGLSGVGVGAMLAVYLYSRGVETVADCAATAAVLASAGEGQMFRTLIDDLNAVLGPGEAARVNSGRTGKRVRANMVPTQDPPVADRGSKPSSTPDSGVTVPSLDALAAAIVSLEKTSPNLDPVAVSADCLWVHEQWGRLLAEYRGTHVAVLAGRVVKSGENALQLRLDVARDKKVHPQQVVVEYVPRPDEF